MKKILLLFGLLVVTTTGLYAQVGIGTTDPLDSAQLEIVAKEKGILIPRLALTRTGDFNPVTGTTTNSLLVYNTATNTGTSGQEVYPGYYYWYEGAWNRVISQGDFSNSSITNTILNKSNIVTYDPTNKTFNYYSTSGTTTSVSVIDVINNSPATQSISIEKIQPGTKSNTVLKTVDKGGKLVTEWTDAGNQAITTYPVKGSDGIVFDNDDKTEVTAAALKEFTVKVKDLSLTKLLGTPKTGEKDRVLTIGEDGRVKELAKGSNGDVLKTTGADGTVSWGKLDASNIQTANLQGDEANGVKITNGTNAVLGSNAVKVEVENLPVSKLKTDKSADKDKVLVTDASGTPKWDKLSADNINGGDLIAKDGVSVDNGVGVLLKTATISVSNVSIDKLTATNTTDFNGKLLKVEGGKVVVTDKLPEGTTVSVTNIRTASPTAGTTTQVVTIDKNGVATVTTIEKLISDTIKVGNGLTKDGETIKLGGKLTDPKTTITTNSKTTLAIEGLTNTGTISSTVDKIMVLGKDNVLHTISATSFKGSGDYIINKDGDSYSVKSDTTTGNTFTDSDGKKYPEKIRTVLIELKTNSNTIQVDPSASAAELSKLQFAGYTEGADSKILMADIRVFSKGAVETTGGVKRSVTYSAVTYSVKDGKGILNPGISSGGFSAPTYKGFYYVTIKYIDKTTPLP